MNPIMDLVNKRSLKKSIPDVRTGDVVKVSQKITEGAKTRVQIFEGMVISREGKNSVTASITVRKIASGVGVEKKFILNSPNIESIKVLRSSKVRRKKIFFLRGLTGKAAKIKEKQRKMLGEIGLKDEEVENAETTEDLAPMSVEEETVEANGISPEEKVEEITDQEAPIEEPAQSGQEVEESVVEEKPLEEVAETQDLVPETETVVENKNEETKE